MSYFIELHNFTDKSFSKSKNFKKLRSKNNKKLFGNEHQFDFNAHIKKDNLYNLKLFRGCKNIGKINIDYYDIEREIELFARDGYVINVYYTHFDVKFQHYWFTFYHLHQHLPIELVEIILNMLDSMIYIKFDVNTFNLSKIYLSKPKILFT